MKCAFWFGIVAYLVASVQIVGAQTPSGDSEWSTIRLQRGHGVEIKTSTGTRRGQLVRVDRDDLVISSGTRATTVNRSEICRVVTYESTLVRRAKYVTAFAAVGVAIGVWDWFAHQLGDWPHYRLLPPVAKYGGVAAGIGLLASHARKPASSVTLYRALDQAQCP